MAFCVRSLQPSLGGPFRSFARHAKQQQLFDANKELMRSNLGSNGKRNPPKSSDPALSAHSAALIKGRETHTRHFSTSPNYSSTMPSEVAVLRFVKLSEKAHPPSKGSDRAAGYDLRSAYDYVIPARGKELVKTDLQIQLPEGCYGRVAPRSGLAWKRHIDVGAGVIDADYTGNIGIVMFNHGAEDFQVKAGDRVAQLICEKICYPDLQEVNVISETARGAGGFGSTGQS